MDATPRPAQARLLLRHLGRALGLAWRVDRKLVVRYVALGLLDALLPVAIAWVGKEIVDAVVAAGAEPTADWTRALTWVGVEAILVIARLAAGQGTGYAAEVLRGAMAMEVQGLVADKATRLALHHFEDPSFMDSLERAQSDATWRPIELLTHGVSLARQVLTLAGFAGLLLAFSPLAVLALMLAALPFFAESYFSAKQYAIRLARTPDERRANYYQQVVTSDALAKEVKLFGLARFFLERWRALRSRFVAEDRAFARARGLGVTAASTVSSLVFYGVLTWIVLRAVRGELTLGTMVLYLAVFRQAQSAFQVAVSSLARAWIDGLYVGNLFRYLDRPDDDVARVAPEDTIPRRDEPLEIVFDGVSFAYPGSSRRALSTIDLRIEPGETVALVGANGAGKTTLVKLLTGLHRPSAGRVVIGGDDASELDPGELRARLGVVFQDFAHYHLKAGENVGVGWVPRIDDREAIARAAARGGAAELLEALPDGYDTMLGRWFGGEQLSIGQWQRVAIARAFLRPSGVLVLDEPTASLDAEAEHALFQRFKELAEGRTVLLVTHRFSTVRMADRIVVLDDGRIAEQGTHHELITAGGLYARMFGLQAEGYRLEAPA